MRSPSIYPVAHANHTLNHLRFAAAVQPMNFLRFHIHEKKTLLWMLLFRARYNRPRDGSCYTSTSKVRRNMNGSVESWVPQTSPWRPSRSQMTKKRLKIPASLPEIVSTVFRLSRLYRNALILVQEMHRYNVSALPISRSGFRPSPGQRPQQNAWL